MVEVNTGAAAAAASTVVNPEEIVSEERMDTVAKILRKDQNSFDGLIEQLCKKYSGDAEEQKGLTEKTLQE